MIRQNANILVMFNIDKKSREGFTACTNWPILMSVTLKS